MIASRPEDEAREVLQLVADALCERVSKVTTLYINDNALGLKGINALQSLIRAVQPTVQVLQFNSEYINNVL